jgi:hypothetical protein
MNVIAFISVDDTERFDHWDTNGQMNQLARLKKKCKADRRKML